ncbi:Probable methyltransferase At1g27930 [Linum perenne]
MGKIVKTNDLLPIPNHKMKSRRLLSGKSWNLAVIMVGLLFAGVLIGSFFRSADTTFLCSLASQKFRVDAEYDASTREQLRAIVHYATSETTPQQNIQEISITLDVLKRRSPCNFLVFGLGFDSLMWSSLNPHAPALNVHTVQYPTRLKEAGRLLNSYRKEPLCSPKKTYLKGNYKCPLALAGLPDEVYEKEWDLIMIDAPRGWFPEAPGHMAAIFSAAVMTRERKGSGMTHLFLHDVGRKVEKTFAEEFL